MKRLIMQFSSAPVNFLFLQYTVLKLLQCMNVQSKLHIGITQRVQLNSAYFDVFLFIVDGKTNDAELNNSMRRMKRWVKMCLCAAPIALLVFVGMKRLYRIPS